MCDIDGLCCEVMKDGTNRVSEVKLERNNLKGYISMFTKITTIKCESFKDPQIIVRPVGSKSKYSRYLLTILSFISMTFRKSGIPILMRIINLKSFLNEPKLLNKKKSNPLKPDSNFNTITKARFVDKNSNYKLWPIKHFEI